MEAAKALPKSLILLFLLYRIINAVIVETFHVPDEYWQSIEVAHRSVFGYGFLTWEWQPSATLRSYLHPALFIGLYKILDWTMLASVWPVSLVIFPKIFEGVLAAIGDICLYKFARKKYGNSFAVWYSIVNLTNWFLLHNLTRTLANSIETTLFSIFLYYWPLLSEEDSSESVSSLSPESPWRRRFALVVAGACFLLRPTSAVTWAFFACHQLYYTQAKFTFLFEASAISSAVLGLGALIDAQFYGFWVSPLISFLKFNFLSSGAAHYGSHPWHWYLSSGIPMLLGPYTLPLLAGLIYTRKTGFKWASILLGLNVLLFSLIAHKEARFLMPLIPILHLFVTYALMAWWGALPHTTTASSSAAHPTHALPPPSWIQRVTGFIQRFTSYYSNKILAKPKFQENFQRLKWGFVLLLIISSIGIAFYTSSIHHRGTIDMMTWVRDNPEIKDLLLLMPCHHTPGLAYVHRPDFHLDYLDCSPGLPQGQLDEADVFYENPVLFLNERFPQAANISKDNVGKTSTFVKNPFYKKDSGLKFTTISEPSTKRPWPTYIAIYNTLLEKVDMIMWLYQNNYQQHITFFHADFADGREGTYVVVFRKT